MNYYEALRSIFEHNGLSGVLFTKRNYNYYGCGRVSLMKNKKYILGYIMDESDTKLKVLTTGDFCVVVDKPMIVTMKNEDTKHTNVFYKYHEATDANRYYVTEIWPVRIKITSGGVNNLKMLISKVVVNKFNGLMNPYLCS